MPRGSPYQCAQSQSSPSSCGPDSWQHSTTSSNRSSSHQIDTPRKASSFIRIENHVIRPSPNRPEDLQLFSNTQPHTIDESTNGSSDTPHVNFDLLASSVRETLEKRDNSVRSRVKFGHERRNYGLQCDDVRKFQDKFLDAAKIFVSQQLDAISANAELQLLKQALGELRASATRFSAEEGRLQKEESELIFREAELEKSEHVLYKELEKIVGSASFPPKTRHQIMHPSQGSISSESTTKTDPMAQKYYSRAGDVKILRERLHNLQIQHRSDLELRHAQREAGQLLRPPEKLFRKNYLDGLVALYKELIDAKVDARHLKRACRKHNVEFEDGNDESFDGKEVLHLSLKLERDMIHHAATQENGAQRIDSLGDMLSGYMDSNTRVESWLADMHLFASGEPDQLTSNAQESVQSNLSTPEYPPRPPQLERNRAPFRLVLNILPAFRSQHKAKELAQIPEADYNNLQPSTNGLSNDRMFSEVGSRRSSGSVEAHPERKFAGDPPLRRYSDFGLNSLSITFAGTGGLCDSCLDNTTPKSAPG